MEMNQTLQAVSVVLKDVLLLVRIAIKLVVFVVMYHHAVKKMVLQAAVNAGQRNVLLLVLIALNLPIPVHHVLLQPVLIQME